ncbi:MAG: vWA domain-containing protein [Rheinheimera sp.]
MLINFFLTVRRYGVPASITEWLDLLKAIQQGLVFADVDAFYQVARLCLVKDEVHYDKFDRACAEYFEGVSAVDLASAIPEAWLLPGMLKQLSDEEKAALQSLGGLEQLLEKFKERLKEQQERHAGGNKWIGTGGSSPFGAYGFHPEGIRVGQQGSGQRKAVKVWDQRQFKDLDSQAELNNRSIQLALRQLRRFARTGAQQELDITATISATSKQAGLLDLKFQNERHNAVKVLMLFDVGGSMDDHIEQVQQLFSAAHGEFKQLEFFYFHNCVYEHVWKSAKRRPQDLVPVESLIHKYGTDYKLIFVGDATMGPYEISYPGGSVEHFNAKSGEFWLGLLLAHFQKVAWLNPQPLSWWPHYQSVALIQQLLTQRMFDLSLDGLSRAIRCLQHK